MIFALGAFDDIPLMQCRQRRGRLPIADATRRLDWSGPWACAGPLHMQAVVYAADGWQWARRAGLLFHLAGGVTAIVAGFNITYQNRSSRTS